MSNTKPRVDSDNFRSMNTVKSVQEMVNVYNQFAPTYDQEVTQYGHKKNLVVDEVVKTVGNQRNVNILDVAAGTGILGELLQNAGFTNIDALDGSQEMLNVAEQKNCYKKLICGLVMKDQQLPIAKGTYEVITIAGGLGINHMREDCFVELARILKPGGSIVSITPVHAFGSELDLFEAEMRRNDMNNTLSWVDRIFVKEYFNGCDGLMHVFRKHLQNKV